MKKNYLNSSDIFSVPCLNIMFSWHCTYHVGLFVYSKNNIMMNNNVKTEVMLRGLVHRRTKSNLNVVIGIYMWVMHHHDIVSQLRVKSYKL